jgi:hypothetical protein
MPASNQLKFGINLSAKNIHTLLKAVVVLNLFFLAGTWLHHSRLIESRSYTIQLLMVQLNLAKENVAASWYSSMLFCCTGIAALLCFWAEAGKVYNFKGRLFNGGWIAMAGVFFLLSFDEMGSFHEMIGETALFKKAGSGRSAGWYAFYSLIGLVALAMLSFFVVKFKNNRFAFLLTVLGVLLFISNPFQEKFEIHAWRNATNPATWRRPVFFLLLEEGSEIFASFCFLYSFVAYAVNAAKPTNSAGSNGLYLQVNLPRQFLMYLTAALALLGVAMLVIHLNAWNFDRDDNGTPHNWPPALVGFVGMLFCVYLFNIGKKTPNKKWYLLLAANCLLVSLYFGCNIYGYKSGLFSKIPYLLLVVSFVTTIPAVNKLQPLYTKLLLVTSLLLMLCCVFSSRFYPAAFGYMATVCMLIALYIHYNFVHTTVNHVRPV